jgi:steroid delta-isomerase-like uncharacterized protein
MSAEDNKALVRREFEEMFNRGGDLDAAEEFYASDYVMHEPTTGDIRGVEEARHYAATYREAFPDLVTTIEDQLGDEDKVATRFRGRGTHTGETEDFGPATGNRIEITGITVDRFADGRIVEEWTNFDALGLLQQIGLIPESEEIEA